MKTCLADIAAYITRDGSEICELMHPDHHGCREQSLAEAVVPAGTRTLLQPGVSARGYGDAGSGAVRKSLK